jgi:hypothetical protein
MKGERRMSRAMDFKEFAALLRIIEAEHNPLGSSGLGTKYLVKYLDPVIDMRTSSVFAIKLRTFGGPEFFLHTQNEAREIPESLFERCLNVLNKRKESEFVPDPS